MTNDVAVAHAHHPSRGGAERVAEHIATTLGAPLHTGYASEETRPEEFTPAFKELYRGHWWTPLCTREYPGKHLVEDAISMWAWEHAPLTEYDTIIESQNQPGWYVPEDDQTIIKYVHSTPRTPYDRFHDIGTGLIARLYSKAIRTFYQQTLSYPSLYLANSDLVAARIRQYWGISGKRIRVLYPPVDTREYTPTQGDPDIFVTVGRLAENKRIPALIEAFHGLDATLHVAGTGPLEDNARRLAAGHDNIHVHGYVTEETKRALLEGAGGFVFLGANEDFGMAPIEAMAAGTPVVGVDDGFTKYQVQVGQNGVRCEPTPESVRNAVEDIQARGVAWTPAEIAAFARENFGIERFNTQLRDAISTAEDRRRVTPEFTQPSTDLGVDDTPPTENVVPDGGDSV